ncbi:unnamed protein product [Oppiella nova]|uniref:Uncharacterized protein n=1 Tax=Oppiella nova TaxID=334625 RepID=A0A7R9MG42_9ACAR|nr:unnamed protein product [Oppiella nova]CAG2176430.1 unnamed protein product [Oppiella nova]
MFLGPVGDCLGHKPSFGGTVNQPGIWPVTQSNGHFTDANAQRFPNSDPGKRIAITPFRATNQTIYKRVVCTGGPVPEIHVNATFEYDTTCNGYNAWVSPLDIPCAR